MTTFDNHDAALADFEARFGAKTLTLSMAAAPSTDTVPDTRGICSLGDEGCPQCAQVLPTPPGGLCDGIDAAINAAADRHMIDEPREVLEAYERVWGEVEARYSHIESLVRALLIRLHGDDMSMIREERGDDRVHDLRWDREDGGTLMWCLRAGRLPWPGIHAVSVTLAPGPNTNPSSIRYHHTAYSLLDELKAFFANSEHITP